MSAPYRLLARKRQGEELSPEEIRAVVRGAADGSWSDARLAAFLTSAAIHGLSESETEALTLAMLDSGDRWNLADEVPGVTDKHSTGGVGDKVSLALSPLLAALDVPVVMLTGRGLGHTGGTADKLESIPGIRLELDRDDCLRLLDDVGMAMGVATARVAPADRKLYALRDETATVESIPLITGSIVSKKLAAGARGLVFDVKTGNGAFMTEPSQAEALAQRLVDTAAALGASTSALLTDMSQPLGRWVGHAAEVREVLALLDGGRGVDGEAPAQDLRQVTFALCREAAALVGKSVTDADLDGALTSGAALAKFLRWAELQGADDAWLDQRPLPLAREVVELPAPRSGVLAEVDTRRLGLLLVEAGGGRREAGDAIDFGISFEMCRRLGDEVSAERPLGRLYLRHPDEDLARRFAECFRVEDSGRAPELIRRRIRPQG